MTGNGRKQLGDWGERIAEHRLTAKGYEILDRKWRCARGEIDLVAQAGQVLVFVEVKTRRRPDFWYAGAGIHAA